jgi:2-dehydropantoate 2-reductase
VRFVTRPGGAAALERDGIRRTGIFGEHLAAPGDFDLAASADALPPSPPDFVLVCTKTFASEAVADALARSQGLGGAPVVLFHNGWGSAEVFAGRLARERVFNARVITGFRRSSPAHVEVTVHAEPIRIGSLFGAPASRVQPLADAIAAGGIPCETTDGIARDLWAKMLYNCALNPMGALLGVPYGELGARPASRRLIARIVEEVFGVLRAAGLATHWSDAAAYLDDFFRRILPLTAGHESSMLQDLRAGRRTEIEALSGAVSALGRRHGVSTPVNDVLAELVRAAEARAGE